MKTEEYKLMIPGPVQPEEDVLDAMGQPVRAHYGPDFRDFYLETVDCLKQVFDTKSDVFIMVGSGSSAIDACIGSALSGGEKVLVGVNGHFGDRSLAIANSYGLRSIPVEKPWGEPLSADDFEAAFEEHPDASAGIVVHLETSTTVVNPIWDIAPVCHRHNAICIVDAVSSLGGIPFHMDKWGIDLCATSSQKCLGAPPGLAPLAVSQLGWEFIDRNPNKEHGWYLNLRVWRQYAHDWADWHPFPITMATNNVAALRTSVENLLAEGIENRFARFRLLAIRLRDGLRKIGFKPFTSDEAMAPIITAAYGPAGVPTSEIVSYMSRNHGIKIAGGLGLLKDKIIRIGHMSPRVTTEDIDAVLFGLGEFVKADKG